MSRPKQTLSANQHAKLATMIRSGEVAQMRTLMGMAGDGRCRLIVYSVGVLFALASVVGCTTLQPTSIPPDEIRYGIRSGALVQPGDKIGVVTDDRH